MKKTYSDLVDFPFMLAPMVGLSHVSLRELVHYYTPVNAKTLWPTEMLNSRRLPQQALGETPETYKSENDSGLCPQILGNEERFIAPSMKKLEAWGAEAVDINMGCPVSKALKHNYGVSLMGDTDYAKSVVEMTVKNTSLPVSVKMRAGFKGEDTNLLKFVEGVQSAGASWVCLHPRYAEDKRRGNANWSQIKDLKENFDLPIIGNGDVQIYTDALEMLEQTNCDGVMIGRALSARPWIFWQLGEKLGLEMPEHLHGRKAPSNPFEEAKEMGRAYILFIESVERYFELKPGMRRIKFFSKVASPWLNFGHSLHTKVHNSKDFNEAKEAVFKFFESDAIRLSERTELRY